MRLPGSGDDVEARVGGVEVVDYAPVHRQQVCVAAPPVAAPLRPFRQSHRGRPGCSRRRLRKPPATFWTTFECQLAHWPAANFEKRGMLAIAANWSSANGLDALLQLVRASAARPHQ
jgi:hypothetical protein